MHVNRIETGTVKGSSHLDLTIDALLAQHGDLRTNTGLDVRRSDIVVDIEAQLDGQTWIILLQQGIEFLIGALGVITQTLDLVTGFGPLTLQQRQR